MKDSGRFELALKLSAVGLLVAVLGLGGYFGWTVYQDRKAADEATPALRVIKALKEQVRKKPNEAILRVRLGEALAAAGKYQEAVTQLNAALKIDPKHTGAMLDLGQVAMMNGRPGEARGYFEKIIELTEGSGYEDVNQRRETALYQLGLIELDQKNYAEAIGHFKGALRIRKDASDTYYYLALALDESGETEDAKRQLQFALAFDPNFAQARYYYGEIFRREGDHASASEQFRHAVEVDPQAKEPREALASYGKSEELVTKARGQRDSDPDAAYETVRIACNVDPENIEALKLLGEILLDRGDKANALKIYEKAQELDPNDAAVKAAVEKLQPKKKSKKQQS